MAGLSNTNNGNGISMSSFYTEVRVNDKLTNSKTYVFSG